MSVDGFGGATTLRVTSRSILKTRRKSGTWTGPHDFRLPEQRDYPVHPSR